MAVAKRLCRLSWIALHIDRIGMWQAHYEEVDLALLPANHPKRLTKINLGVARAM